ncbi:hypothetical protein BD780_002576 [Clostridium tetanomorphum]|uniref:hypothetical protein n=1 Tax=Clostridium tetanomorphum TaxID=1553 RepID=UPI0004455107|nr:hypothetical protein [Clostridium tetanomorphum]KAJ51422.1 hypothetical protein CTM_12975 [Clostridium tetanomorphum DSM 665]MBP1866570.1 hypothetical protein [Clostridium tetanomorphum]NRS85351.1 hypothetical protein [Clostridium tetanomorphum]NRZ98530.1 hypothetical protein [Clostridium tetanomorphum]SQC02931.1 Uncharacterised protein [Clostridium tetanomorphum]
MYSIKINKTMSYSINSAINKYKTKDNHKNIGKNSNNEVYKEINDSVISKDAVIGHEFLSRIEASFGDVDKVHFIEKYALEYEKIKDEIVSGKYGNDTKKYMRLLDNAFKDSLENAVNILGKTLEKTNMKDNKIKFSGGDLIKYQKQYETATGIAWILRAENKRIAQEIEIYRKKKDHRKVTSLIQLRNTYRRIINNVSDIATKIRSDIDDNYSEDNIKE